MSKRSILFLCAGMLCLGIALGAGMLALPRGNPVHAIEALAAQNDGDTEPPRELSSLHQSSVWLAKISNTITPSVVHIQSERRGANRSRVEETGSGVVMASAKTPGSFIVTNRHVIEGAELGDISILLNDGRELNPERVWSDRATDIAVMKITADELTPAKWGDSNRLEIGHLVLAAGSPFGLSRSVTLGIISAKGRRSLKLGAGSEVLNQDFLQTDAAINPGNSGGPLIDMNGRVIGINTAIASQGGGNEGIGFSIPSNLAQRVMEQLLETGSVRRGYLGVRLDPAFDAKGARRLKLDRVQGTRVVEVYSSSPASRANLQVDDVVLSFDGLDVQDESHLINLVSLTPVGKAIRLTVWRDGKRIQLSVTLAERVDPNATSDAPLDSDELGVPVQQMGLTVQPFYDAESSVDAGEGVLNAGLLILNVADDSPLAAELAANDVLIGVNRRSVSSVSDLEAAIEATAGRENVLLQVRSATDGGRSRIVVWRR
jgi:serine protease Do